MRVIAIDSGSSKRDLCLSLGAEHFLDFATTTDIPAAVNKITTYGAHATLIFAGSRTSYEQAPHMLRVGGTMVCVALPKDASIIAGASPALLCMKALKVVGSLVGTRRDVDEALQWTARGLVKPILSHGTIEDINGFCEKMEKGDLVGRAVIKIAS